MLRNIEPIHEILKLKTEPDSKDYGKVIKRGKVEFDNAFVRV